MLLLGTLPAASAAPSLDKEVADLVDKATYEVVVKKPDDNASGLAYEKPLPWDLVPYAVRTDDYIPLGTAFAIGPNTFVSAGHVMKLHGATQWDKRYLRDKSGEIYEIDTVSKAAVRRDFAVFSLEEAPDQPFFQVNGEPTKNEQVYAVGNALGQGIVIREGRYTSRTPEELNGEWKWLRFSAAASPGNSGGPLLDKEGRVIGVVLRKSENENLNYALPISEVKEAEENVARIKTSLMYRIENMDKTLKDDEIDIRVDLPKPLGELRKELTRQDEQLGTELADRFFTKYDDEIFPDGEGSVRLLHNDYNAVFPRMIGEGSDGNWEAFYPEETNTANLADNGSVTAGSMFRSLYLAVQKPDSLSMERFTNDSKKFMDLIHQALPIKREVGSDQVRLTSLGEAERDFIHTDDYGRKWQVRVWSIPYEDTQLISFSLPVPGGNVTILKNPGTSRTPGLIYDLKKLTNFIYISYYGTLEEWRDYLALDDLLPEAFADIDIDFEYGDHFRYESDRLSLEYGPDLMDINKNSDLKLYFSYYEDDGEVAWDVSEVMAGESESTSFYFYAERQMQPAPSMKDDAKETWRKFTDRKFPYNEDPFFKEDRTFIGTVADQGLAPEKLGEADHLYAVVHAADGEAKQGVMEKRLKQFMDGLEVKESPM